VSYPTWTPQQRVTAAILAACYLRPTEVRHVPPEALDALIAKGYAAEKAPPDGFARHHATVAVTDAGRAALAKLRRGDAMLAATDGIRLMAGYREGSITIREDWTMQLHTLGRWQEYRVSEWRDPVPAEGV